ncbi:hypothetical protein GQ43DRAFT_475547 [Delitschia confertaspora ATCC 74209]|uniref:Cryptic loci regulator 2 N-terminal domain-containing protein n=1 Tax=Delitschia confertaspora ATCC 74209 TaxID=1513339 RepID=A0A9P4MUT1_9PLEO|nr:hypothetical protein GQ43DRAFT_475547 [Delitschia confertaspora ATCC 74209]
MSAGTVIVPLWPGSDGDATHRPTPTVPPYSKVDPPTLYLEKIGMMWMEKRREALPGVKYVLERLPTGYELYERPRLSDAKTIDKFLFGHPYHKYFNSPNRFFPHFLHLMENRGSNTGCPCALCLPKPTGRRAAPIPNASSKPSGVTMPHANRVSRVRNDSLAIHKARPKTLGAGLDTTRVDEEGNPDVYRNLIDRLRCGGSIDEEITEPMSLDWRAEQELIPSTLQTLQEQPQWIPRTGDLVIFVRNLGDREEICYDDKTSTFKLYDHAAKLFTGFPKWEAGVVGQPPAERMTIEDLVMPTPKETAVNYSGLRIEPISSPNETDKFWEKRYTYVPLHHTRPMVFWKDYVGPIPEGEWHPTVKNALRLMSVFSLMGKYRFKGTWPSASIFCHGMFIGSEMFAVGDAVRVLPKVFPSSSSDVDRRESQDQQTDVLIVQSIQLKLSNLDLASDNDYDQGRPYTSTVYITGTGYTQDKRRSGPTSSDQLSAPLTPILEKYGTWYPLHGPDKAMQVPLSRILGRAYEYEAMVLWFPSLTPDKSAIIPPSMAKGVASILEARAYASENDHRIDHSGASSSEWFWGDTRAEALDIHSLNGMDVSKYDNERDLNDDKKMCRILEEMDSEALRLAANQVPMKGAQEQGVGSMNSRAVVHKPRDAEPGNTAERTGGEGGEEEKSGSESSSSDEGIISSGRLPKHNCTQNTPDLTVKVENLSPLKQSVKSSPTKPPLKSPMTKPGRHARTSVLVDPEEAKQVAKKKRILIVIDD